ncbi:hydrogenase maturation protease [bacterium]|nr:hydrogenase maturation protease [bacterium]
MKTLVLGLGNDLYGDDGTGLHVIRRINQDSLLQRDLTPDGEELVFEECPLTGVALLDVIPGYDRLIIVDTIKKPDPETGKVQILEQKDLRHIPGPSPHYISIPQTIELGEKIGLPMPQEIKIVAVEAKNLYQLGEGLTPKMVQAIPHIIQTIKQLLHSKAQKGSDRI